MFGAGAINTESYFTLTLFHILSLSLSLHIMSLFFLRVFEAAYAEKASSSFYGVGAFSGQQRLLLRILVAGGL